MEMVDDSLPKRVRRFWQQLIDGMGRPTQDAGAEIGAEADADLEESKRLLTNVLMPEAVCIMAASRKPDERERVIKSTGITTYAPRDQRSEEAGPLGRTEESSHTTSEVLAPITGLHG